MLLFMLAYVIVTNRLHLCAVPVIHSKECQAKAWTDHKAACKKLRAQANGAGTSGTTS